MPACDIKNIKSVLQICLICFLLPGLSACASISYYAQSITGQLELLSKQKPIDQIINDPGTQDVLKDKLKIILRIRKFANEHLNLPNNGSYTHYVDTGREFIVWNVFAAPELSLEPAQWCFFIVGCLSYRGYFSEEAANNFASELNSQGYDVFVGGVTAYSTLGWFDDPVLNTILRRDDTYQAKLIFHELAHQKIYIKNDTEFNEAFADAVASIGVRRWLERNKTNDALQKYLTGTKQEDRFIELVMKTRNQLEALYKTNAPDKIKLLEKNNIFANTRVEYEQIRVGWDEYHNYDSWFNDGLNNAKLSAVIIYRHLMPGFINLFERYGEDIDEFYSYVEKLGECSQDARHTILVEGRVEFDC